jgi:hypothetical protein
MLHWRHKKDVTVSQRMSIRHGELYAIFFVGKPCKPTWCADDLIPFTISISSHPETDISKAKPWLCNEIRSDVIRISQQLPPPQAEAFYGILIPIDPLLHIIAFRDWLPRASKPIVSQTIQWTGLIMCLANIVTQFVLDHDKTSWDGMAHKRTTLGFYDQAVGWTWGVKRSERKKSPEYIPVQVNKDRSVRGIHIIFHVLPRDNYVSHDSLCSQCILTFVRL